VFGKAGGSYVDGVWVEKERDGLLTRMEGGYWCTPCLWMSC
jgi:hypothetical protein